MEHNEKFRKKLSHKFSVNVKKNFLTVSTVPLGARHGSNAFLLLKAEGPRSNLHYYGRPITCEKHETSHDVSVCVAADLKELAL